VQPAHSGSGRRSFGYENLSVCCCLQRLRRYRAHLALVYLGSLARATLIYSQHNSCDIEMRRFENIQYKARRAHGLSSLFYYSNTTVVGLEKGQHPLDIVGSL
jgi:hypothetical protein